MTIFLTGISGLLGTNLALLLLENGYTIKALVRNINSFKTIAHERLQLIQGTLSDDLSAHLINVDTVIHAAAECRQDLINYTDYYQPNYIGTKTLLDATIKLKVRKFIFVSTANTIGYGTQEITTPQEDRPMRPPFTRSMYARSKAAAEAYILNQREQIQVHIINPTFIIGPYDSKPGSGKIVLMSLKKRLIFYPPGGKNFVAVKEVCTIIRKCINSGINGKRYLAAGENFTYLDFFRTLKKLHHRKQLPLPIPSIALQIIGGVGDILRFYKIKTIFSSNNMKTICVNTFYGTHSGLKEFNITNQPIAIALQESITYFQYHHLKKQFLSIPKKKIINK